MIDGLKDLMKRLLAMMIDVGVILCYAGILFLVVTYVVKFKGTGNVLLLNLIGFVFMFVPGLSYFSWMEYKCGYTFGKKTLHMKLSGQKSFKLLLVRNTIKLIPWQLGHMLVYSMYGKAWAFDTGAVIYLVLIYGLIIFNCFMIVFTTSHQSIYDRLTHINVITSEF